MLLGLRGDEVVEPGEARGDAPEGVAQLFLAVVGIDTELVHDFVGVLTPVSDVDEGVVQRRAVVTSEAVDTTNGSGGSENVGRDDFLLQPGELAIGERDSIERIKLFTEILLQSIPVANVGADRVLEVGKFFNERSLKIPFANDGASLFGGGAVGEV